MEQISSPQSGKCLVICEKPSVASDLLAAFGGGTRQDGYFEFSYGAITWCFGHLLELVPPEIYSEDWKRWEMGVLPMVPSDYGFRYGITAGKDGGKGAKKQLGVIAKLLANADYLVNAADAGREGELIFWEAAKFAGWGKDMPAAVPGSKPCYRFWSNKMTHEGLRDSWNTMKPIENYLPLARAAYCRSESDWLLGINLSRAASLAFPRKWGTGEEDAVKVWSVGRVQTPVLALIVRRDLSIENFVSKPFYELRISYKDSQKSEAESFGAVLRVPEGIPIFDAQAGEDEPEGGESGGGRRSAFLKKEDAEKVLSELKSRISEAWSVEDQATDGVENPPGLFSLTALQRWCNQAWGWSAQKTLTVAQAAYEEDKVLTYPRTTSAFLPDDSRSEMDGVHSKILQEWVFKNVSNFPSEDLPLPSASPRADFLFDSSKVSDHFAIVPTGIIPSNLGGDVGKLWTAVVRRFLTAFAHPARVRSVKRKVSLSGFPEGVRQAFCSGKTYVNRGWLEYDDALSALTGGVRKSSDRTLALCGPSADFLSGNLHEGATSPPRGFDEASLLAVMENISAKLSGEELEDGEVSIEELKDVLSDLGLGTPATRADVIETLLRRGFIVRAAKGPVPKAGSAKAKSGGKGTPKYICSTPAGRFLIESLEKIELSYLTEAMLTAQWEKRLSDMSEGRSDEGREAFLSILVDTLQSAVSIFSKNAPEPVAKVDPVALNVDCPKSGEPVLDLGTSYRFPGLPDIRFWKTVAKREMSPEDYVPMVGNGKTELLEGFIAKSGKSFSAHLALGSDKKMKFEFPEREQASGTALSVLCPKSNEPVQDCGKFYRFPGLPKFAFWKAVAQRPVTPEEYVVLVGNGKTDLLEGFVSKKGSKFAAYLLLGADGKTAFEFPPREGGSAPAKGGGSKIPKGKKK